MLSFEAVSKRVLIAPLHWGLGHATRCIPLIERELNAGNSVIISANGGPKALLAMRFPELEFIDIPFMTITYPKDGNMAKHFFLNGPKLLQSIWREHRHLQRIVREMQIDLVISDSRFGLWTSKAKSVFITHQVQILSPVFQGIINWLNRWVMGKYDEVWIPDYEVGPGLGGKLSHPKRLPKHARYIGPLSRFNKPLERKEPTWKAVVIISGPEPQRSLFEAEMARRFIESGEPALMLSGKPEEQIEKQIGALKIVNHLEDEELLVELAQAERVISRSGYSSIMDYHVLGIEAELHATPGQTEQEYLAGLQGN
ncbi:MAG: glycosyltransferase [Salibacteraceae bacterium]